MDYGGRLCGIVRSNVRNGSRDEGGAGRGNSLDHGRDGQVPPGQGERAAEIAEGPFTKASNDIGGGVIDLHFNTGEWDFITVFPMAGGPSDLTWLTSPVDIQFMNALTKHAGSMDAAKKLLAEWDTLVTRTERHVAPRTERHVAHRHDNLK